MKPRQSDVILALFLLTLSLAACGGRADKGNTQGAANVPANTAENVNSPKTNVEELGVLVNIPYESEDIVWKEFDKPRKLIAVLRFSPADADKIVAEAGKNGKTSVVTVENETWFPDDLIAYGDMSGDDTLKGTSYPATAFLQEPFNEGRIVRIEGTNYFVLEASVK